MLFITFDQFQQYSQQQYLIAIAILGVVFFLLGWIISKLIRPSSRSVHHDLNEIRKELLDELNIAKKFNADYHLLVKKEEPREE